MPVMVERPLSGWWLVNHVLCTLPHHNQRLYMHFNVSFREEILVCILERLTNKICVAELLSIPVRWTNGQNVAPCWAQVCYLASNYFLSNRAQKSPIFWTKENKRSKKGVCSMNTFVCIKIAAKEKLKSNNQWNWDHSVAWSPLHSIKNKIVKVNK
jgi:hypothetical protein